MSTPTKTANCKLAERIASNLKFLESPQSFYSKNPQIEIPITRNMNDPYMNYIYSNILNHRKDINLAHTLYNCECNSDYKFKAMCSK